MTQRWRAVGNTASIWSARDLNLKPPAPETNALPLGRFALRVFRLESTRTIKHKNSGPQTSKHQNEIICKVILITLLLILMFWRLRARVFMLNRLRAFWPNDYQRGSRRKSQLFRIACFRQSPFWWLYSRLPLMLPLSQKARKRLK